MWNSSSQAKIYIQRFSKGSLFFRSITGEVVNCLYFPIISVYKNCAEVYKSGSNISGVYRIDPDGSGEFEVFCDQKTAGGGWTVFQKRMDGSVDFFRTWVDYKRGFGNLTDQFSLGLDKIHRLTVSSRNKLRVSFASTWWTLVIEQHLQSTAH